MSSPLVARNVLPVALARLDDDPVLLLEGPRSVGKSTLLAQIAQSRGAELLDLDDPATADAVAADPAAFVAGERAICIDEYQKAPQVLDAIKAELNRDSRPGRFVLTGSARHDALPPAAQALTGRLSRLAVYPLSQGELIGTQGAILEQLLVDPGGVVAATPTSTTAREAYVERVVAGGFPMALARLGPARNRWLDDYVRLTVERDVRDISRVRQSGDLRRVLEVLAGQTAQVLNLDRAANAASLQRTTVDNYVRLLEKVFLLYRLDAWGRTLGSRVAGTPKIHVLDSGVAARLLRLSPERLARLDPAALTEFGHLLATFVAGELLKQVSWIDGIAGVGHWRTHDGDEVDLVIEADDGAVTGFEIKAAGRISSADARPLMKLRDRVGASFRGGVILYTGPRAYALDDRIYVMPIDGLWR